MRMGLTRVGLTDLNVERSESECECVWKGVRLNASGSDETECELVLIVVVLMMLVLTSVMAMMAIMTLRTMWVRMVIVSIYQACSLRAMNHHRPAGNGTTSKSDIHMAHRNHTKLSQLIFPIHAPSILSLILLACRSSPSKSSSRPRRLSRL